MTKITLLSALSALLILPSIASAATTADFAPGPGETATAGTWTRTFTVTTAAAGNAVSKGEHIIELNVTAGSFGGMLYRQVKMNKDQTSYFYAPSAPLSFGSNTITVGAVTNAEFLADPTLGRTVRIQFNTDIIGFNTLTVNGLNANPDEVTGSPFLGQSFSASENFDAGPDATWQAVLPLTTVADGAASQDVQTAVINVTYIPAGGANYRVYQTSASGGGGGGAGDGSGGGGGVTTTTLVLGENTITVPAVTTDRTVDVQFSNNAVEFKALTVNGEDMLAVPPSEPEGTQDVGDPISDYPGIFAVGSNAAYPAVATLALTAEGAATLEAQTLVMNITYIPAGGASYRVYKTLGTLQNNGSGNVSNDTSPTNGQALTLGVNTITVPAVTFTGDIQSRTVKAQFSGNDIEFDALSINGADQLVTTPGTGTQGEGQSISESAPIFVATTNPTWVTVATMTTTGTGAPIQGAQTLEMNVTYIPGGGAQMRRYNSNEFSGGTFTGIQDLTLGINTITVPAVSWANPLQGRATKIQFTSVDVEFDALTFNGVNQITPAVGTPDVGDPISDFSNIITDNYNATWFVATMVAEADGAASRGEQTAVINVTYIPTGGATWRSNITDDLGAYIASPKQNLVIGENTFTVPAVGFDRTVKIQFSSNAIEFTTLTFNGVNPLAIDDSGPKVTIANSNLFNSVSNETWVTALTTAVRQDGASSHSEQRVELYITSLPASGAMYRVYRTINADADPDFQTTGALNLGLNTINVSALGSTVFDRAVKIQFNSEDIEFNALSINGVARVIGANVTEAPSLSIDNTTLSWTVTSGTTLQFSKDLESWTSLPTATSPYTPSMNNINSDGFYRMISDEEEDGGEDVVN